MLADAIAFQAFMRVLHQDMEEHLAKTRVLEGWPEFTFGLVQEPRPKGDFSERVKAEAERLLQEFDSYFVEHKC